MAMKRCFKQSCELEVQYICKCSYPETYSCSFHFGRHLKLTNRAHNFEFLLLKPCEEAGVEIIENLKKEELKKLRNKAFTNKYHCNQKNNLKKRELDPSATVSSCFKATLISKNIRIKTDSKSDIDNLLPYGNQTLNSLNIANSEQETEKKFIRIFPNYENRSSKSNLSIKLAYNEYTNTNYQCKYLYLLNFANNRTNLVIYNTESNTEELKKLKTPELIHASTCIAQLPNGDLFCFGNYPHSGITLLINSNFEIRVLPSGAPFEWSSAIYFNNNIYCFGGNDKDFKASKLSCRFDLDRNHWVNLTLMQQGDLYCNGVLFNGNILISGWINKNLLLYSTDIDSFSTIPYEFTEGTRKILINTEERIYLIECAGSIYESGFGDEYAWEQIGKSIISHYPDQVACAYNKGGIYIGYIYYNRGREAYLKNYYKFSLDKKVLKKLKRVLA